MAHGDKSYRFVPRALADLEDIWSYTARTWSPDQADTYHRRLITELDQLAAGKRIARPCGEVRPGLLKLPAISHVIFFREAPYGYKILRIIHKSRDWERHV